MPISIACRLGSASATEGENGEVVRLPWQRQDGGREISPSTGCFMYAVFIMWGFQFILKLNFEQLIIFSLELYFFNNKQIIYIRVDFCSLFRVCNLCNCNKKYKT